MDSIRVNRLSAGVFKTLSLLFILSSLSACGGGGSGAPADDAAGDTMAPEAKITFPTMQAQTASDAVTVHGTTVDDSEITVVRVNGVDATTQDGYSNWSARISLAPGENVITVETGDIVNNVDDSAAQIIVNRQALLLSPEELAFDDASNRAMLLQPEDGSIVAVDLVTGNRTSVSNVNSPGISLGVYRVANISVVSGFAYLTDSRLAASGDIYRVDLATGEKSLFSSNTINEDLGGAGGTTFTNNELIIVDDTANTVVGASFVDGTRRVISNNSQAPAFSQVTDIVAVDDNLLLVIDNGLQAVVSVDLTTGNRSILSDNTTPNATNTFNSLNSIAIDTAAQRALVVDSNARSIIAVRLSDGSRSILASSAVPDSTNSLEIPESITIDSTGEQALILDRGLESVVSIDLSTGSRSIVSSYRTPAADTGWGTLRSLAHDSVNNRVLIMDNGSAAKGIHQIDLSTGIRSLFSSSSIPDGNNTFGSVNDLVMDAERNRVLALDRSRSSIIGVDLDTGVRTVVSSSSVPNADNPFYSLVSMTLDSETNTAYVLGGSTSISGTGGDFSIFEVDLLTGQRSILSDNTTPDSTIDFFSVADIALDKAHSRLLVIDNHYDALVAVDLTTGARTVLSDDSIPNGSHPMSIALGLDIDIAANQALVADNSYNRIITIDLETGARSILSDPDTPYDTNPINNYYRMVYNEDTRNIYIVSETASFIGYSNYSLISLVQRDTGERVVFSK